MLQKNLVAFYDLAGYSRLLNKIIIIFVKINGKGYGTWYAQSNEEVSLFEY